MTDDACRDCGYYDPDAIAYEGAGLCRRYPPAPTSASLGTWSVVKATDWCGEYAAPPAPPAPATDACPAYTLDPASLTEACTCGHMPQDHAGGTGACTAVIA